MTLHFVWCIIWCGIASCSSIVSSALVSLTLFDMASESALRIDALKPKTFALLVLDVA
jgi:hypothetical protein